MTRTSKQGRGALAGSKRPVPRRRGYLGGWFLFTVCDRTSMASRVSLLWYLEAASSWSRCVVPRHRKSCVLKRALRESSRGFFEGNKTSCTMSTLLYSSSSINQPHASLHVWSWWWWWCLCFLNSVVGGRACSMSLNFPISPFAVTFTEKIPSTAHTPSIMPSAFNLETCARPNILALQPYRCARE